jgi:hypothetical protein
MHQNNRPIKGFALKIGFKSLTPIGFECDTEIKKLKTANTLILKKMMMFKKKFR